MVGIQCLKVRALGIQADTVAAAGITVRVSALDSTILEVGVAAVSALVSPSRGDTRGVGIRTLFPYR